jgi:hypothetical protein
METKLLLPNFYKRIGWIVFVPCLILTVLALLEVFESTSFFGPKHILYKWTAISVPQNDSLSAFFDGPSPDFAGEILMTLTAIGFFFIAFSKEKIDDEWIMKVRLESLLWGFCAHILGFLLATWLSYNLGFYMVLSWNMLVAPLVFLARFHWVVYIKSYLEQKEAAL